jgi:hypothetical protein
MVALATYAYNARPCPNQALVAFAPPQFGGYQLVVPPLVY